ncbi:MAG: hypothetical protein IK005_10360 [Paludibacteraceae bacterium]|nr:hypothetical protein [Paludibacteraceae bacterium]
MKERFLSLIFMASSWGLVHAEPQIIFEELCSNPEKNLSQSQYNRVEKGDVNKDGIEDIVIISYPNDSSKIEDKDEGFLIDKNQPTLVIYFGTEGKSFKKFKEYPNAIAPVGYGHMCYLSLTEKGVIRFQFDEYDYKDADPHGDNVFLYRFQNGDFYRIGESHSWWDKWSGEGNASSINYLTGKKNETTHNGFDQGQKRTSNKWTTIEEKPISLSETVQM